MDAARESYVEKRRDVHQGLTETADAWYCRGMSIYEWRRRFSTPELVEGWRAICSERMEGTPTPEEVGP